MKMAAIVLFAVLSGCGGPSEQDVVDDSAVSIGRVRAELRGINIDPRFGGEAQANPSARSIAELGATRVRFSFKVQSLAEATPDGDFAEALSFYGAAIDRYRGAGLEVLMTLSRGMICCTGHGRLDPGYIQRFADRAGAIAAAFHGKVHAYEIWNEEDDGFEGGVSSSGSDAVEPTSYAALLSASYAAIKGSDPGAIVVLGGLDSAHSGAYLDQMGEIRADAIAVHPYLHWPTTRLPASGGPWYPLDLSSFEARLGGRELWFTEWGTPHENLAPSMVRAMFTSGLVRRQVSEAYYFAWSDAQTSGNFGVDDRAGRRKPAIWTPFQYAAGIAPTEGPFGALWIKGEIGAGAWITSCADEANARVWRSVADGPLEGGRFAEALYPQRNTASCGAASHSVYPLVFTSHRAGELAGVWVTECSDQPGSRRVWRVETAIDGHPAAIYQYEEQAGRECAP